MKYPKCFPYPSSWLNAFLLCLLTAMNAVIATVVVMTGVVMTNMTDDPTLLLPVVSLALLSPIGAIAIVHHIIHLFLSRYAPQLQAPEIGKVTGAWPQLMSWWEGIWGCAAMVIASVGTIFLGWVIQPLFNIDYQHLYRTVDSERFGAALFVIWLTIAAYLYQCFYLVEHRLMVVARADRRPPTVGKSAPQ